MDPVNWIAVALAWGVAAMLGVMIYGRSALPYHERTRHTVAAVLLLLSATMMGHMFARVSRNTLDPKPWLYFMMSGGLALAFVGPALFISYMRRGYPLKEALQDYFYWSAAYLVMGAMFWVLG